MDAQVFGLLGLALGSAGVAGLVSVVTQASYPRRLQASIRRLTEAKEHVAKDPRVSLVVEQAIRQDVTLLALSRLNGLTVWGVFFRIVLALVFAAALIGGVVTYLRWRPADAGPEYVLVDTTLWVIGLAVFSYPALGMTALHFERRAKERRLAATVLLLEGTSVETDEIRHARRRWARSRRIESSARRAKRLRWYGEGHRDARTACRVERRWEKARAIAIRRLRAQERGPTLRDLIRSFDRLSVWPYVVNRTPADRDVSADRGKSKRRSSAAVPKVK